MTTLGKRARQKLERPTEILEAALEEFVRKGYVATRLEDVAKAVGVTKGTIYFYFETKEALFSAVIRHFAPALDETPIESDKGGSTLDALTDYLTTLHTAIAVNPRTRDIFHLLMADGRHFPELLDQYFEEFLAPAIGHLREYLARGVERGEFRQTSLVAFPEILVAPSMLTNIWTVVFGNRKPIDHAHLLRSYLDMLINGVRNRE